jgi:hypothetical protein
LAGCRIQGLLNSAGVAGQDRGDHTDERNL